MNEFSDQYIKDFLSAVAAGLTEYEIPESLYFGIANYLKKGLYEGFGGTLVDFGGKDLELLKELRSNVYRFSAAKSYHEMRDIRSMLFDEDGRLVDERTFQRLGSQAFDKWNSNYAFAEYHTAVGQAQMAVKWEEIEANKDLLPIIVFDTTGHECEQCAPFNGFAAPVDDRVWNWLVSPLHFNCMCVLRQEERDFPLTGRSEYANITELKSTVPADFQMNPGKDRIIFNDKHPYFTVEPKDRKYADDNFNLPIPEND